MRRLFSFPPFRVTPQATYSIAYIILASCLLTLNPFQFQAYDPAEWWVWHFLLRDVCQNILLFVPLGILLRHSLGLPYGLCLVSGFLISLSMESAQLFLTNRTSNFIDLMANSAGAWLGALLYRIVLIQGERTSHHLNLAMMLIPLCWLRGLLTLIEPGSIWLLVPNAILAVSLLTGCSMQPHQALLGMGVWFLIAFAPLAQYRWKVGLAIAVLGIATNWLCNYLNFPLRIRHISMLGLNFLLSLNFGILWSIAEKSKSVNFWPNLPWIEVWLAGLVLIYGLFWNQPNQTKDC